MLPPSMRCRSELRDLNMEQVDSDGSAGDGSPRTKSPELNLSSGIHHSASNRTVSSSHGTELHGDYSHVARSLKFLDKQASVMTARHEKPPHSYIALISMAILSSPEQRMILGDIYSYITDNFPYYSEHSETRAWRNSVRHNLSLNECFVKSGRAENGKGNYWAIHSACIDDFRRGDYRRRQARQRASKSSRERFEASYQRPPYRSYTGYVAMTPSYREYPRYHNWTLPQQDLPHFPPIDVTCMNYDASTSFGTIAHDGVFRQFVGYASPFQWNF